MSYRILVVDDSAFMRKIVSDLIERDPACQVIDTAKNGREAIEKIAELSPDLVTMDVEMPEMNGLDALRVIMERHPLPVIMLSGINEQGMRETIMALELGAFDFIRKPSASTSSHDIEQVGRELHEQIKSAMLMKQRRANREALFKQQVSEIDISVNPKTKRKSTGVSRQSVSPISGAVDKGEHIKSVTSNSTKPVSQRTLSTGKRLIESRSSVLDARSVQDKASASQTSVRKLKLSRPDNGTLNMSRTLGDRAESSTVNNTVSSSPTVQKGRLSSSPHMGQRFGQLIVDEKELEGKTTDVNRKLPMDSLNRLGCVGGESQGKDRAIRRTSFTDLVAIGTSTGGPKALKAVLEKIPKDFPAPIVIVQHMPPNFTKSLAQRLDSLSTIKVVEAEDGMLLESGTAYIAPGGYHMCVSETKEGYKLQLSTQEPRNGHRPSVDVLYESLISLKSLNKHIVLLTGMGSDGARAMKKLYDAGVTSTIAESEETCVVYGMPRSAIEMNCVTYILALHDIGPKLVQIVK